MTPLQDFCQEPRTMEELVDAGFKPNSVYSAVKKNELKNTKATDDWGRRTHGKGLFLSTVTIAPMNFTALATRMESITTTRRNSMSIEKDLEELIAKIAPSKDIAGGFMSRDQIIQLIRKVATDASLIGYCYAERLTRERMDKKLTVIEQELTIIKEQLKDTEIELIVATK
jgi:hypothetical protein